MKNLPDNLLKDSYNLFYLNVDNLDIHPIFFDEISGKEIYSNFYTIGNNRDYILKDTPYPLIFHKTRTLEMLKNLNYYGSNIEEIDFPIGYYYQNNHFKGTIVPYYPEAFSVMQVFKKYWLKDLSDFYNHDEDEIKNILQLYLDIITLIEKMFDNNIAYLDIAHGNNFLFFDNKVKVIDFEPDYIKVTKYKDKYLGEIINSLCRLISILNRKMFFYDIVLEKGRNFEETKSNVKNMEKRIRGIWNSKEKSLL